MRLFHFAAAVCALAVFAGAAEKVPLLVSIGELADRITVIEGERSANRKAGTLRALGDINGDGFADIAFWGAAGTPDGAESLAYIFYGSAALPRLANVAEWSSLGIRLHSTYGNRPPMPIGGMGDLNEDGFDDLAFMPCFPEEAGIACPAYILFGGAALPSDIDTSLLETLPGCRIALDAEASKPEIGAAAAGDLNGDGIRDMVLTADMGYLKDYRAYSGIVYVVLGSRPFPEAIDLTEVGRSVPGCKITSYHVDSDFAGVRLGMKVCAQRDFNGDGLDDLVVSASRWDCCEATDDRGCGGIFVVFGRTEWPAFLDLDVAADRARNVCWVRSCVPGSCLGEEMLDAIDDVTGDGLPDLLVSASAVATYLISGARLAPGEFNVIELATAHFDGTSLMQLLGLEIGDWDGDGIGDLAMRSPAQRTTLADLSSEGCVSLVPGMAEYPAEILPVGFDRIVAAEGANRLGKDAVAADMNGDGRKDLVISAPGPLALEPTEPCRIYVIPHGTDLLGPLECREFAPNLTTLGGGARLTVWGRGFDATTALHVGDSPLEILARPHSCQVVARIAAAAAPGSYPVRLVRGDQECTFTKQLEYYDSIFPRETDVRELGEAACTLVSQVCTEDFISWAHLTGSWSESNQGGEDVTGDGLADVVIAYGQASLMTLLHGAANLPSRISVPDGLSGWATTFALDPPEAWVEEYIDAGFGWPALSVGDMNGDQISELVIAERCSRRTYLVLGGELPKDVVLMSDLIAQGRCITIEECPWDAMNEGEGYYDRDFQPKKIGDVNGDGLADFCIAATHEQDPLGIPRSAMTFVLGRSEFPAHIAYDTLPKMWGKDHSVGSWLKSVNGLGDVDDDGCDDLSVTIITYDPIEFGDDPQTTDTYIFFGRREIVGSTTFEEEVAQGRVCKVMPGWQILTRLGDVNGDGIADVGVTLTQRFPGDFLLHVIYGGARSRLCTVRTPGRAADFDATFLALAPYNWEIHEFWGGRDFDGDGIDDILISDCHLNGEPPGRAIVIFGGDIESKAGPLSDIEDCFELVNPETKGEGQMYLGYPGRLEYTGDVNGDGYVDLAAYDKCHAYIYYNPLGAQHFVSDFVRGDANQDGMMDIADAIYVLQFLFARGRILPCMDAGDTNDDERIDIADAVKLLMYLFSTGPKPPLPPPNECGADPEGDTIDCRDSVCP